MNALLVIWFGVPLLAFLSPYVAHGASAMVALWGAVREASSANNWPMAWHASVWCAETYTDACALAAHCFDDLLMSYRWAVEPNLMIRLRFIELDPYIWEG